MVVARGRTFCTTELRDLYITDYGNNWVREARATGGSVGATSPITTVAGTGNTGYNGDGIAATTASLVDPTGVTVDAAEAPYILFII